MEKAPIFVRIDNYKDILKLMIQIKEKTDEAKSLLEKINKLKNEEDTELQIWQDSIEDVERKLEFVSRALGEPE